MADKRARRSQTTEAAFGSAGAAAAAVDLERTGPGFGRTLLAARLERQRLSASRGQAAGHVHRPRRKPRQLRSQQSKKSRGDRRDGVATTFRIVGRGKHSGAPVEHAIGVAYKFRHGKLWRMRAYLEPGGALKAVGLEEEAPTAPSTRLWRDGLRARGGLAVGLHRRGAASSCLQNWGEYWGEGVPRPSVYGSNKPRTASAHTYAAQM